MLVYAIAVATNFPWEMKMPLLPGTRVGLIPITQGILLPRIVFHLTSLARDGGSSLHKGMK